MASVLATVATVGAVGWMDDGCSLANFKAAAPGDPGVAPISNLSAYPGAVCLDGTPGAYYHLAGTGSGAKKWYIHHQGGGWCESLDDCLGRSKTQLGSSKQYPPAANLGGGYFSTDPTQNPMMYNWNHVLMRYCDGASFSGNAPPTPYQGSTLHWAGKSIREAVVTDLMKAGLGDASDVVVSGCSAGGLATYLHTDQWCDALPNAKCVGLPDSGFFLDYQNAPCTPTSETETKTESRHRRTTIPGDYHCGLKWTYTQQQAELGVNQACIAAHAATDDKWKCMFAEHSAEHIKHPVFAMQSQYDSWQTGHVLAGGQPVQQMGDNITSRLQNTLMANNPESGAFLDSCHHHCGAWNSIRIDGDLVSTAIQKWYEGLGTPNNKKLWNQDKPYPCTACCTP
mmetsp:Transcript_36011/g.108183  ORF Transcript_36011/g.108183 Transcript_36011/m.108183 type:complete len:397 (+) Transcript_36011:38-1228(+)|eukprot:CAMPEP_0182923554 /NCGR_PEP_ID=MMETSP0105_2-20130417/5506_1 /TAXON_ID=81532 ORGANISM="Acanthoeca-like sp., Strain 10tr" /NCGR_SAMPLE_ID=MMETSP0105_2 /ASSEMBLY_ACC=CAM_ASM_000205 /LENGTH=396 /DNA_ID=CAMNT_0025061281 /DNA_START=43 /DNA_END=1233 /DNA_ORIENTATION=+